MTQPKSFIVRMVLFLAAVGAAGAFLFMPMRDAFLTNAPLNGLILGVLFLGIFYNFRQVARLFPEVDWLENYRKAQEDHASVEPVTPPRLLSAVATMLGERNGKSLSLSALSTRSLLDGIYSRLDESRDLSRYTIGLLVFLGLLGTFWGLIGTISSIGDVIASLSVSSGDAATVFGNLKKGLEAPLDGMGTAFSSSLFGLAGSLILGFLDLQASQAQNRFFNQVEEWLSTITRLSSGGIAVEGDQSVPAYVQALLEQTAESLENLQRTMTRGEDTRTQTTEAMNGLTDKVGLLTDHMRTEQAVMKALAENQVELKAILVKLTDRQDAGGDGFDEGTRTHIRNLDGYMARLLEELNTGREDVIQQLRSEIKLLARTIAAASSSSQDQ